MTDWTKLPAAQITMGTIIRTRHFPEGATVTSLAHVGLNKTYPRIEIGCENGQRRIIEFFAPDDMVQVRES